MTSIEIPVSIAAALPSLAVMDITNDVSREVGAAEVSHGIAYLHAESPPGLLVRHGDRAVASPQRDGAPIAPRLDRLDAAGGPATQEGQRRLPVVGRAIGQTEPVGPCSHPL